MRVGAELSVAFIQLDSAVIHHFAVSAHHHLSFLRLRLRNAGVVRVRLGVASRVESVAGRSGHVLHQRTIGQELRAAGVRGFPAADVPADFSPPTENDEGKRHERYR